jgi:hypothetical protein
LVKITTLTVELFGAVVVMSSRNVNRRVKLYYLDEEGKWSDQGTGYVTCEVRKNLNFLFFIFRSEN